MSVAQGYQCQACSYKGRQFPQGICPACGSNQVTRLQTKAQAETQTHRWSVPVLVLLWGYLAYALFEKFSG
jgi:predicted RNA-binding Zn-ribbon protein involved in translation (DUF1610 family)